MKKCFFTIVELLIVIVIITILTMLLLPALKKARTSALRIQCASNLKVIGTGHLAYISDNNDYLVEIDSGSGVKRYWYHKIGEILYPQKYRVEDTVEGSYVFRCPEKEEGGYLKYISYGMNCWQPNLIFGSSATAVQDPYKAPKVRTPSETMLCMDAYGSERIFPDSMGTSYAELNVNRLTNRHNNGCNALFFDGHVEYIKWPYPNCATGTLPYLFNTPHKFWMSYE